MSKRKEREALASSIEKFLDSAVTHIPYTIERNSAADGPRTFHIDTLIEYLEASLKAAEALR